MNTQLVPLEEFEAKAKEVNGILGKNDPRHNGLACPVCGTELFDSDKDWVLMMYPLKVKIHCEGCDYRGSREAVDVSVVRRLLQSEWLVKDNMMVQALWLLRRAAPYLKTKITYDETELEEDVDRFLDELREIPVDFEL